MKRELHGLSDEHRDNMYTYGLQASLQPDINIPTSLLVHKSVVLIHRSVALIHRSVALTRWSVAEIIKCKRIKGTIYADKKNNKYICIMSGR